MKRSSGNLIYLFFFQIRKEKKNIQFDAKSKPKQDQIQFHSKYKHSDCIRFFFNVEIDMDLSRKRTYMDPKTNKKKKTAER